MIDMVCSSFALAPNAVFSALQVTALGALVEITAWVGGSDFTLGCLVGGSCNLVYSTAISLRFTSSPLTFFSPPTQNNYFSLSKTSSTSISSSLYINSSTACQDMTLKPELFLVPVSC